MTDLNVIAEGELAALLAFWLSNFVLRYRVKGNSCAKEKPPVSSSEKIKNQVEHLDAVITDIIPMHGTLDHLVKATPIQSIPTFLANQCYNLKEDWVRETILKGVETNIYMLSTIEICWLSSMIEEIFGVVMTTAKIEELVNVDRVKALSCQDFNYSSQIAYIEGQLNNIPV
ncbi:hypothetical protein Cgig2_026408 [Carnegiea gigantea]|uniref:Uncharacterized protein n=1 Tax=Carnegiea gigantea TaxID=171969 RepID=A0A9Q1QBF9_9CARY|nr:hypothetical protein Cgig2_026408 [Carnegiea gigantea]